MGDEFDFSGDSDYMEIAGGLIPEEDGWMVDKFTGNRVDPEGRVFDRYGELLFDPGEEDPWYE